MAVISPLVFGPTFMFQRQGLEALISALLLVSQHSM